MDINEIKRLLPEWTAVLPDHVMKKMGELHALAYGSGKAVYPPPERTFRALELTPPSSVKCVIIGQDPYHGEGQANGLAFSVPRDKPAQPSLQNIMLELVMDIGPFPYYDPDLSSWARQGVLLLNSCLTVERGAPASHSELGWQAVTEAVLHAALARKAPVAMLSWGAFAHGVADAAANKAGNPLCRVFASSHPSPYSVTTATARRPAFRGSRPFSKANAWLASHGAEPVDWLSVARDES